MWLVENLVRQIHLIIKRDGAILIKHQAQFNANFKNVDDEVNKITNIVLKELPQVTQMFLFNIDFILRELFNNAVEHGNKMNCHKKVSYQIEICKEAIDIKVCDEGKGFLFEDTFLMAEQEDIFRQRNRGLKAIKDLGIILKIHKGCVCAKIKVSNRNRSNEKERCFMEFSLIEDQLICKITTNLVATNIKPMIEELQEALEQNEGYHLLQLDLSMSKNIDSMGVTFLIGTFKTLLNQGKKMQLVGVSEGMLHLFKVMKLDEIFEIVKG